MKMLVASFRMCYDHQCLYIQNGDICDLAWENRAYVYKMTETTSMIAWMLSYYKYLEIQFLKNQFNIARE